MDEKSREEFIQLFNQGFEEVVRPELEELSEELAEIRKNMATKADIESINRKFDHVFAKDLEQDQRLTKIESVPVIAHALKIKKAKN